ncbi:hypothetical protein GCM10009557_89990 [Virgisporangium ochraceum]|uniref:Uncharacterized protein n=1 Tax=Virgisporangium ochraceum TaxID=65505 RepID=A0A8J3ZXG5_9ACTN|nr:DUF6010 family protein [Virgisporangium ochraceum]GIJ72139.1 hypothetical protein Voc01_070560 [Virgisporangium ochraceum]
MTGDAPVARAGAGAAYLSGGGPGGREFAFTAALTYVAFRGLDSWTFIGVGWLLHTAWDVVHHLADNPIVPSAHDSSLGCAIFAGFEGLLIVVRGTEMQWGFRFVPRTTIKAAGTGPVGRFAMTDSGGGGSRPS